MFRRSFHELTIATRGRGLYEFTGEAGSWPEKNKFHDGLLTLHLRPASAALDVARTVCRRAERRVCALSEAGELKNPEIIIYLNRLSDLLWLFARWVETKTGSVEK